MSSKLTEALGVNQMAGVNEAGATTWIADWVIALDLEAHTHMLYVRMCRIAKTADRRGVRLTLSRQEADEYSRGDGKSALLELLDVQAIKKIGSPRKGHVEFEIELYPPEVRAMIGGYAHVGDLPVVAYG